MINNFQEYQQCLTVIKLLEQMSNNVNSHHCLKFWKIVEEYEDTRFIESFYKSGNLITQAYDMQSSTGNEEAIDKLRKNLNEEYHNSKQSQSCSYPKCNCPFDAPYDPDNTWCARGLSKESTL